MRLVVRNSFARESIRSERVRVPVRAGQMIALGSTCTECGSQRFYMRNGSTSGAWLYRFYVDRDYRSGPIVDGKLFCSRSCAESYLGRSFDETK